MYIKSIVTAPKSELVALSQLNCPKLDNDGRANGSPPSASLPKISYPERPNTWKEQAQRCDLGLQVGCGWREVLERVSGRCRAALHPDIRVPHCLFSPRAGISYPGESLNAV